MAMFAIHTSFAQKSKNTPSSANSNIKQTTYTCTMHPEVVAYKPGKCPKCKEQLVVDRKGSKQVSKMYTCSMHPDVTSDKPGKCPKCEMDLTEVKPGTKPKKG